MPKGFSAHNQRAGRTVAARLAFYSRDAAGGCRLWIASKNRTGYGKIGIAGSVVPAHRAAWIEARGPIPQGMCVCHRCDTPSCIAIDHLFLGTRRDNTQDMITKGRTRCVGLAGEESPHAVLTAEKVRALRADRRSAAALAPIYGVSFGTICRIRRRESWEHIA